MQEVKGLTNQYSNNTVIETTILFKGLFYSYHLLLYIIDNM